MGMNRFTHAAGQFLAVGSARLYIETAGHPAGTPLLLLHGGLGHLADFNLILDGLPPEFRLIGIDFRGHGKSTLGTEALSYALLAADVEAVLAHLGIERCALLGFSDGGIVGYRLAVQHPALISALVTVGAQWRLRAEDPEFGVLAAASAERWAARFPEELAYYQAGNPQADFTKLFRAAQTMWTDLGPSGYPQENIARIVTPTLIVRGEQDGLFSAAEAQACCDRIPGAICHNLPAAGHEAHRATPGAFLEVVNEFLRQPAEFLARPRASV